MCVCVFSLAEMAFPTAFLLHVAVIWIECVTDAEAQFLNVSIQVNPTAVTAGFDLLLCLLSTISLHKRWGHMQKNKCFRKLIEWKWNLYRKLHMQMNHRLFPVNFQRVSHRLSFQLRPLPSNRLQRRFSFLAGTFNLTTYFLEISIALPDPQLVRDLNVSSLPVPDNIELIDFQVTTGTSCSLLFKFKSDVFGSSMTVV